MLVEGSAAAGIPLDLDRIHAAVVSHLHADHSCGLEDFGYYSFLRAGAAGSSAHASGGFRPRLERTARRRHGILPGGPRQAPVQKQLADYFELIDLDQSAAVATGPFTVECRRTIHGVPTYAFRVHAGGRTLGFSADTAYDPTLIDWLSYADLIVHEATNLAHTGVHTPYEKLAALPAELRARMR